MFWCHTPKVLIEGLIATPLRIKKTNRSYQVRQILDLHFFDKGTLGYRQNSQRSCLGGGLGTAIDPKFSVDIAGMRLDRIQR